MKTSKYLITGFALCLLNSHSIAFAQAVPKAKVGQVKQVGQTVEFEVNAPEPFYVGNNVFILHIGTEDFDLSRQEDIDGKGKLVFLIPAEVYKNLKEGSKMQLTYGEGGEEVEEGNEETSTSNISRSLGTFSKKLFSR